jgi:hypothetical protein
MYCDGSSAMSISSSGSSFTAVSFSISYSKKKINKKDIKVNWKLIFW